MSIVTRTFAGSPSSPKSAVEPVNRLVSALNQAGYGCALHQHDLGVGKFWMTGDTVNGFAVSWNRLHGLREVSA